MCVTCLWRPIQENVRQRNRHTNNRDVYLIHVHNLAYPGSTMKYFKIINIPEDIVDGMIRLQQHRSDLEVCEGRYQNGCQICMTETKQGQTMYLSCTEVAMTTKHYPHNWYLFLTQIYVRSCLFLKKDWVSLLKRIKFHNIFGWQYLTFCYQILNINNFIACPEKVNAN